MNIFLTGASTGMGLAMAEKLCDHGHQVWGTSRHPEKLPKLPRLHPVQLDLCSLPSIRQAFAEARQEAGHFDALINNAGAGVLGPVEGFSPESLRAQMDLLVTGPHELIRLTLPDMRARNTGRILNITSLAVRFPVPFLGPYNAAKAALGNLTQTLRLELGDTAIQICEIQPGDFCTNFQKVLERQQGPPDYDKKCTTVWEVVQHQMNTGPHPALVAELVARALTRPVLPPVLTVGSLSQAWLAPLLDRLLPAAWFEQGLRRHYKL